VTAASASRCGTAASGRLDDSASAVSSACRWTNGSVPSEAAAGPEGPPALRWAVGSVRLGSAPSDESVVERWATGSLTPEGLLAVRWAVVSVRLGRSVATAEGSVAALRWAVGSVGFGSAPPDESAAERWAVGRVTLGSGPPAGSVAVRWAVGNMRSGSGPPAASAAVR
jgi:hypothetical protein